jgi:hypothetical protein
MRYWYEINNDIGCVFAKRSGSYVHSEWMAILEAINNDVNLRAGMNRHYDYREAEGAPSKEETFDQVRYFGGMDETLGPRKVAIVASQLITFGMSRMYGTLRDGSSADIRQFKTIDEAAAWLELPPEFGDPFPSIDEMQEMRADS